MQYLLFGLMTGSVLLLGTVGFAMIRRAENFLNIAHGQFALVGAYLTYFLLAEAKLPFLLAALVAVLITAVLGVVLARVVFRPVHRHGPVALLFTSIGLAYVIYGVVIALAGAKPRSYPAISLGEFSVGSFRVSGVEVAIIVTAALTAWLLHVFLTRTTAGKAIRAVASNPELARVRGIDTDRVSTHVWLLASALAALSGILVASQGVLTIEIGWHQTLLILSAAVLGGLGNIYGVMIGSLLMGLAMDLSVLVLPTHYRVAVAFLIVILVLLFRPQGIVREGA